MLVSDFNSLKRFMLTDGIFVGWVHMSQVNEFDNPGTHLVSRGSLIGGVHQVFCCLKNFGLTGSMLVG